MREAEEIADMSETSHSDMFESLSTAWETAINEKRQREVILSGVIAYLFFHEKKDTGLENGALMYVREAIDNLFKDKFGQQPPDVAHARAPFAIVASPKSDWQQERRGSFAMPVCQLLRRSLRNRQISKRSRPHPRGLLTGRRCARPISG
jgi:hypothetical protein